MIDASSLPAGPHPSKLYLPIPQDWHPRAHRLGAGIDAEGVYVHRRQGNLEAFGDMLPRAWRTPRQEIAVCLIPETSWGASLAKLLTPDCWSALRRPVIEFRGGRCELCGGRGGTLGAAIGNGWHPVDCHESWKFCRGAVRGMGVQVLERLMSVCQDCHLMFHLGFANARGVGVEAQKRLVDLNQWDERTARRKIEAIFAAHGERSKEDWGLDLSTLGDEYVLEFKGGDRTENAVILGVRFRMGRNPKVYGPVDPSSYYRYPPLRQVG